MALTRTVPGFNPEITPETLVAFPIDEQTFDLSELSEEERMYMEEYNKKLVTRLEENENE